MCFVNIPVYSKENNVIVNRFWQVCDKIKFIALVKAAKLCSSNVNVRHISRHYTNFATLMSLVSDTMKGVRAMVILSFLASLYSFVLSILYTFVHAIGKGLVLQLLIAIAGLPGNIIHSTVQLRA